ncbi:hypothetical protein A2W13_02355 [Candidatus Woesebacteria bacterium RBG_16_36_11]|uniref:Phosphoglycerate mutase n=1 Tax=Candidatus Woesebacteria bacterium RBG_16_36_11 TaxID=1802481 RepID=A0A1F7X958_9BACT|nr:MAG: hypothetical protein A2W13_02355 [Candidatus Woesebacteria bacterium RBG_16_36_11]
MFIFLLRHAEGSDFRNKWQTPDSPLSDLGIRQAQNLSGLTRFKRVDLILSSKWRRAAETAKIISKLLKKPLEFFEGINEREQHSKIYGADRLSDISKRYYNESIENYNDLDWKFEDDEESVRDISKRAFNFSKHLTKKHLNQNLLVVSHDMFIRCFITICLLGKNYEDKVFNKIYRSLQVMNTGVSLLEYIEKRKTWKIWYLNDFSHLSKIKKEEKIKG